jgi:hypothetical protein
MRLVAKKSFVVGVDESDPEFRAHIMRRLSAAHNPKRLIPVANLKKQLEQRRKQLVGK